MHLPAREPIHRSRIELKLVSNDGASMPSGTAGWWVYIVRCADGTLYTGVTTAVARRVDQHNAGTASKYTRSRRPVTLVHRERTKGRGPALSREAVIKQLTRRDKELLIAGKSKMKSR